MWWGISTCKLTVITCSTGWATATQQALELRCYTLVHRHNTSSWHRGTANLRCFSSAPTCCCLLVLHLQQRRQSWLGFCSGVSCSGGALPIRKVVGVGFCLWTCTIPHPAVRLLTGLADLNLDSHLTKGKACREASKIFCCWRPGGDVLFKWNKSVWYWQKILTNSCSLG